MHQTRGGWTRGKEGRWHRPDTNRGNKPKDGVAMDQIRIGWSRDNEGWWHCTDADRGIETVDRYFKVKVTLGEEDKLIGVPDDEFELQLLNVLQYATHVDISDYYWINRFGEVLESAADPVPALEALVIPYRGKGDIIGKVLNAIKSKKMSNLKTLVIHSELDDGLAEVLASAVDSGCLPSLGLLHLSIGRTGHLMVAKGIESAGLLKLKTLNLSNNEMGDDGCEAYANALSSGKLPSLKCILFGQNGIGPRGIKALGRAIESGELKDLTELNLSSNPFFHWKCIESGHIILADHMRSGHLRALEKLDLSHTNMGGEACDAYAKAIISGELPSLRRLEFSQNQIGDGGAEALGRAIRSGALKILTFLGLAGNCITGAGNNLLANSFLEGEASPVPDLRELNLSVNPCEEIGVLSLAESLKSGHLNSLEVVDLNWSVIDRHGNTQSPSEKSAEALVSAFSSNIHLTVDVKFEWYYFPVLERRIKQLRTQNIRHKDILAGLKVSPKVPAVFGKVYICGDPEVGKTTLRRALQRSRWEALLMWERRHRVEERTRGIDVSQLSSLKNKAGKDPITLLVWDMAGQEDYHLVHNAFFPDLSSAEGKATSFVVVCSSKKYGDESKEMQVQRWWRQLEYWLKFIASSCGKSTDRRNVFIVLNNFNGERQVLKYEQRWKVGLEILKDDFKEYLNVQTVPFIMDVRKRDSIQPLKTFLLEHSRSLLKDEMVPEICRFIQRNLADWSQTREQFPVLDWTEFVEKVRQSSREPWDVETLEAATKYLNEAGLLIYIDKEAHSDGNIYDTKLVVMNPSWFCNRIVGNMFLHQDMGHPTNLLFRKKVNERTGSISESQFRQFFRHLSGSSNEWRDEQFPDLISILLWLGVCYKGQDQNLYIPALIDENVNVEAHWDQLPSNKHGAGQWVMGFSVEHKKSKLILAPIALWHKFQVELAQSTQFNGRPDYDFMSGKYFMIFNVDFMDVLIKVAADKGSPTFDGISIFVRPSRKVEDEADGNRKKNQVDLANDLVEILLRLWVEVCPGVDYLHRVVWPWPASQSRYSERSPEAERNVEVAEVQKWVRERDFGKSMQWAVGSCTITEDQLLSTKDCSSSELNGTSPAAAAINVPPGLTKLNDSLWKLHAPDGPPAVDIIFFHGLQVTDKYEDAFWKTWVALDDEEIIWPKEWIKDQDRMENARIFSVTYNSSATNTTGQLDMYALGENLVGDIVLYSRPEIGQTCPVVLVGHCLGGIVIKQLVLSAVKMKNQFNPANNKKNIQRIENFLNNCKGAFFYATPNGGSKEIEELAAKPLHGKSRTLGLLKVLSTETGRINQEFADQRKIWDLRAHGIGENGPTKSSGFNGVVVNEASARSDVDGFYTHTEGDHFTVCRARDSNDATVIIKLTEFIAELMEEK